MFIQFSNKPVKCLFALAFGLTILILGLPKSASAQEVEVKPNTVTFKLEDIYVHDLTAGLIGDSGDDDPYFIIIKFRSRFLTPGSTSVVVCGHTPNSMEGDPLCGKPRDFTNIDEGETKAIPDGMNGATFTNVHYSTLDSVAHGDYPEMIGVAIVAMENDHSLDEALDAAAGQAEKVRQELVSQIEQGQIIEKFLPSDAENNDSDEDESGDVAALVKGVGCGGEGLSQLTPSADLSIANLIVGGLGTALLGPAGLVGFLIGVDLVELFADNPVDIRVLGYLTIEDDRFMKECNDIDINNAKKAFLTVLPQNNHTDCGANAPCHRFARDGRDLIKFRGLGGEWHVSLNINADAMKSQPKDPSYQRKTSPIVSHTYLPLATNGASVPMEATKRTVSLDTLQYNVQFLTPWNAGKVEPSHWPNTHERAVAIGEALACYDLVALNESVNDARRQAIINTMRDRAPTCGKPNLLLEEPYFTSISGPRVQDGHITDLNLALSTLIENTSYTDFYTDETRSDYLVRNSAVPVAGDELTIISRYPIVEWNSYIYQSAYGIDAMAAKGILHARIQVGDTDVHDYIDVFSTHLQAGSELIRRAQILELADFISEHANPSNPVILLGDFNVKGPYAEHTLDTNGQSMYDYFMQVLTTLPTAHVLEDIGLHLTGGTNHHKYEDKHRKDRIDHIFLSPNSLSVDPETVSIKEFDGNGWRTLSDHAAVEANIVWEKTLFTPIEGKPDLIVEDIQATAEGVQITIKNEGDAPVMPSQNLWIDLYINPHTPPTSVNQLWSDMGSYGLVWGVNSSALPLPPGAQIVLTLQDPYFTPQRSNYSEVIKAGSHIYVQVDSSSNTGYGGVLEKHEELGDAYNNISSVILQDSINTSGWGGAVSAASASESNAAQSVMLTTPRPR